MRLARVGMENAVGFLLDFDQLLLASLPQLSATDLHAATLPVLDVRRGNEYASGHVPGARNIPLHELERRAGELGPDAPLAVICASGYRSSIAASILASRGHTCLFNVVGGTAAWMREGFEVEKASS